MSDQFSLFGDEPPAPPPKAKAAPKASPAPVAARAEPPAAPLPPPPPAPEPPPYRPYVEPTPPDTGWVRTLGLWHYLRQYKGACGFDAFAFRGALVEPAKDDPGPGRLSPVVCGRCYRAAGACVRCKVPAGCAQHRAIERACTAAELEAR